MFKAHALHVCLLASAVFSVCAFCLKLDCFIVFLFCSRLLNTGFICAIFLGKRKSGYGVKINALSMKN